MVHAPEQRFGGLGLSGGYFQKEVQPTLEQVCPEGLQPVEGPTLEHRKRVRRKERQIGTLMD